MSRCRAYEASFLKLLCIKRRIELTNSFTQNTLEKWHFNYENAFQYNNKASFKKPSLTGPAVFDALSNKKIFDLIWYCSRMPLEIRKSIVCKKICVVKFSKIVISQAKAQGMKLKFSEM
jgi:hypothetical protein